MSLGSYLLVFFAGLLAGIINVFAGGGSLLTLPTMILAGLPAAVANGTNRVALIFQNVIATNTFRRKGISNLRFAGWLAAAALPGALIGAMVSVKLDDELFRRILAILMILVVSLMLLKRSGANDEPSVTTVTRGERIRAMAVFTLIGFYAGFIQAGIGFLIISSLGFLTRLDLIRINAVKLIVILACQVVALTVFIYNGAVDWTTGIVLAMGNSLGGYLAAHLAVRGGERWAKRILVAATIFLAAKMLGVF